MQARENSGESRTQLALVRGLYPESCGYRYETGGILKNLRERTSHEKVKKYHKEFYRPENLCLIICGDVKHDEVFQALAPVEKKILSKVIYLNKICKVFLANISKLSCLKAR